MTKTNNSNSKNFFNVDFFHNTISGSTASFKKASKGVGPAYEELCRLMKEQPTFTLVEVEPKKHIEGKKQSYEGLNIDFMKTYIGIQENKDAELAEFANVKKYAEDSKLAVFPFIKKWFIEKYGEEDVNGKTDKLNKVIKHFDMELAKAKISAFHQNEAQKYGAPKAAAAETSEAEIVNISA